MGKRNKGKSNRQGPSGHFDRLAELKQDEPILSALQADQLAVDQAVEAFLNSALAADMKAIIALEKQVEEKQMEIRTLHRQSEEAKTALSMLEREEKQKQDHLRKVNEQKLALKTNAKNRFLNHPKIQDFKSRILAMRKNWAQVTDEVVMQGLASDARYQELEAEGLLVNKSAEKLARQVASATKKHAALEKKITRLQAEVEKLNAALKVQKGAIYG